MKYRADPGAVALLTDEVVVLHRLWRDGLVALDEEQRADLIWHEELGARLIDLAHYLGEQGRMPAFDPAPYEAAKARMEALLRSEALRPLLARYLERAPQWRECLRLERSVVALDSLHLPAGLRDFGVAEGLLRTGQGRFAPYPDEVMEAVHATLKDRGLLALIDQWQQRYKALSEEAVPYADNLKDAARLKELPDAEARWKEVLAPCRGKVVYADFWFTGCTPCLHQMDALPPVKAALHDVSDELVLLYICVYSADEGWRNVIKEKGLASPNSLHYNLPDGMDKGILQHLGVRSFPTYLVFDREGNLIDRKPPRPQSGQELTDYLHRLVRETRPGAPQQP